MKEPELNDKACQSLRSFESLEDIQPSAEWTRSMMDRLGNSGPQAKRGYPVRGIALVLVFFILANLGVVLSMISDGTRSFKRGIDLRTISREFLINPTSISE